MSNLDDGAKYQKKKVDTAQFVGDLDSLTSGVDQSYAEKSKKWRSLDDNIKVHDLSYDELPNKANVQLGWELEDGMTTQVSNNEILGDVYLPQVEKYEDWMNQ